MRYIIIIIIIAALYYVTIILISKNHLIDSTDQYKMAVLYLEHNKKKESDSCEVLAKKHKAKYNNTLKLLPSFVRPEKAQ